MWKLFLSTTITKYLMNLLPLLATVNELGSKQRKIHTCTLFMKAISGILTHKSQDSLIPNVLNDNGSFWASFSQHLNNIISKSDLSSCTITMFLYLQTEFIDLVKAHLILSMHFYADTLLSLRIGKKKVNKARSMLSHKGM